MAYSPPRVGNIYDYSYGFGAGGSSWFSSPLNFLTSVTGLSLVSSMVAGEGGPSFEATMSWKVLPIMLLGALVEIGRRLCLWFFDRFKFRESHVLFALTTA